MSALPKNEETRTQVLQACLEGLEEDPDPAARRELAERLFALNEAAPIGATVLETVAEIASDRGDTDVHRRALELLAGDRDPEVKTRALEGLGDLFAQLGDRRAAIDSWRPAAQLREETPSEPAHARRLYERVLDTLPDDQQAAERLVQLYADARDWKKIPEVLGVVLRANEDRGAELVLQLQESAWQAGALDQFVALVDEAAALRTPSSRTARSLRRAKARALAANPARHAEASATYRALLETFGGEDDPREYQSFIESRPDPGNLRWERRWLYQWRAQHDVRPVEALREWAEDEEHHGEVEEASAIYRRVLEVAAEADRPALALKLASLFDRLGRIEDALLHLAPLLAAVPPMSAAREMVLRMLADAVSCATVAERLEAIAKDANDATCVRLLEILISAREQTLGMPEARRRWYRRALELASSTPVLSLPLVVQGARDLPDEIPLWDAAERMGSELGELNLVVGAYRDTLGGGRVAAPLAEVLGRRMMALEGECSVEASVFVDALQHVLEIAPRARWALDRVKLALGALARWDHLFRFYDRAIGAADEAERVELLHEAALAARDLAGDAGRAIRYFASIRLLTPDDTTVAAALERLFEREGRKGELIELLGERAERSAGTIRQDYQRRIVALWLELGNVGEANAAIESALADGTTVADVTDLLERIACHRGQARAIERLCAHYESLGQMGEVVRVAKAALDLATETTERTRRIHELVRVRVAAAQGEANVFVRAMASIGSDIGSDRSLAKLAYRSLLVKTIVASKRAATDAEFADALEGAWRSIEVLRAFYVEIGDTRGAARLLERGARLPFERSRQRALLQKAAVLCADRAEDRKQAIRLFTVLFEEAGNGAMSSALVGRFAELLEAAGEHAKLAGLWEEQGHRLARMGNDAEARDLWVRAATLWDRQGASERAVAAYELASALGSEASFEALARLHANHGAWAKARAVLEWLCAHAPAERRALHTERLAEALSQLGEADRARECLEATLRSSPPFDIARRVRARLITLYREASSWRSLVDALCNEAALSDDGTARAALFCEASSVLCETLAEPADAARLLELAVTSAPSDASLRPKLADVLESLGQLDRVAEVLSDQILLFGDRRSKERGLVHHRLAGALVQLGCAVEALAHLTLAAKMHPTHPAILHDLAQAALVSGDLDLAEKTYRALLLAVRHPKDSAPPISYTRIFLDLGTITMRKGDALRAANLLESGLDAALEGGEDGGPFEEALRSLGRHDLVARAVESRMLRSPDASTRTAALRELAALWSAELGREPELEARLRRHADAAAEALEAWDRACVAWDDLWSVRVSLGDDAALVAMIRQRLDGSGAGDAAPLSRAWLLEAGARCTAAAEHELAASVYAALFEADPRSAEGWAAVESAFALLQKRDHLAPLLERAIALLEAGADRARLRMQLASLVSGQPNLAIELLSGAVDDDPTDARPAELLASLLEKEGRLGELATILEQRLERGRGPAADLETAWQLGRVLEQSGREADAARLYGAILDVRPIELQTISVLADRLEAVRSPRLADCLELWIACDEQAARTLAPRLVELRDAQGGDVEIVRALELALATDPTNDTFVERFVRICEAREDRAAITRVLRRAYDAGPQDRALLRRLLEAYRVTGAAEESVRLLDVAIASHPGDVELVCWRATARAALGDDAGAATDLRSIRDADASQVDMVVELLASIVEHAVAPAAHVYALLLVDVLVRAGRLAEARGQLEGLLARNPRHTDALDRLASLEVAAGAWARAADAYARLVSSHEQGGEGLPRAALGLADACTRAGCPADAREPLERALRALPANDEIAQSLEGVCEAASDWERLSELLVARAERGSDGGDKATLLVRAATLLLDKANQPSAALRLIELARCASPESVEAALAYARVQMGLGRPREAVAPLEAVIERNKARRCPLLGSVHHELGKAHLALDELAEALDALKAGFAIDSRSPEIAMLLGLLAVDLGDERTAERALLAVVTFGARAERSAASSADSANALFHLAAMAYANGDLPRARRWVGKAVREDAGHGAALALLQRLDAKTSDPAIDTLGGLQASR